MTIIAKSDAIMDMIDKYLYGVSYNVPNKNHTYPNTKYSTKMKRSNNISESKQYFIHKLHLIVWGFELLLSVAQHEYLSNERYCF